jgi:hypothetical protein
MPRYRYERGHTEYYDPIKRRTMERPSAGYRVMDATFGQIANCHLVADAERIVEALNATTATRKEPT